MDGWMAHRYHLNDTFILHPYLPILVLYSVDAVLVDPPPDSCPVYLIVGEVVIEMDAVVLVLQLVRNVGVERYEDEELPVAPTPEGAGLMGGTKCCDGVLQT